MCLRVLLLDSVILLCEGESLTYGSKGCPREKCIYCLPHSLSSSLLSLPTLSLLLETLAIIYCLGVVTQEDSLQ